MSEDFHTLKELHDMMDELPRLSQIILTKQKEVDSWTKKYSELELKI